MKIQPSFLHNILTKASMHSLKTQSTKRLPVISTTKVKKCWKNLDSVHCQLPDDGQPSPVRTKLAGGAL